MKAQYHLVTVTLTYRIDDATNSAEAVDIVRELTRPPRHLYGVQLETEANGFCSEIAEDEETGIECKEITDFGPES